MENPQKPNPSPSSLPPSPSPKTIHIQIDQLILEGVDVSPSQRVKLQAAIEAELARLVKVNGLPVHLQGGGRIPKLPASLSLTNTSNPMQLGQEIAQAIYGGMSL